MNAEFVSVDDDAERDSQWTERFLDHWNNTRNDCQLDQFGRGGTRCQRHPFWTSRLTRHTEPRCRATRSFARIGIVLNLSSSGTATGNLVLPGGTYSLTAHYQGDGTFGSSDSPPPGLSVNISAEPSKTLISLPTFNPNTGFETGNAPTTLVYGSPYIGRVDVGNVASFSSYPQQPVCNPPNCPTGTITLTDALNGGAPTPLDAGTFLLNSSGFTEDLPIQLLGGTHLLFASYSGDNSFKVSSGSYAVTVTPAATRILPPNPPLPPMVSTPFSLSVILTPNAFGVAPSCNLTFFDGTTVVPGTVTCGWQANGPFLYVSLPVSQATPGTHTYMAKFNGDTNYAPSTSAPMTTRVFYGTTTTLSADSTNVQSGTSITLTALVDSSISQGPPISQSVSFMFDNNPVTGTVTYSPFTDSSGNLALRASLTTVPQSSGFYTSQFRRGLQLLPKRGPIERQCEHPRLHSFRQFPCSIHYRW